MTFLAVSIARCRLKSAMVSVQLFGGHSVCFSLLIMWSWQCQGHSSCWLMLRFSLKFLNIPNKIAKWFPQSTKFTTWFACWLPHWAEKSYPVCQLLTTCLLLWCSWVHLPLFFIEEFGWLSWKLSVQMSVVMLHSLLMLWGSLWLSLNVLFPCSLFRIHSSCNLKFMSWSTFWTPIVTKCLSNLW